MAGPLLAGRELGYLDYPVDRDPARYLERVRYFELRSGGPLRLGATPTAIRERRWLRRDEVGSAPLVNEGLRPLLLDALARVSPL